MLITITSEAWVNIIGTVAGVLLALGYLPQTVHTLKSRKTDDIATGTFLLMGIGGFLFAIQGYISSNWPLFITNMLTTIMSAIIFGIKVHNDHKKKKAEKRR